MDLWLDVEAITKALDWENWNMHFLSGPCFCVCILEERRNVGIGDYCTPRLNREHSVTSTVAPVGSGKEIEYFFASDARFES